MTFTKEGKETLNMVTFYGSRIFDLDRRGRLAERIFSILPEIHRNPVYEVSHKLRKITIY